MKNSLIATAVLASIAFAPTTASANYYGYDRCVKNGGGYFGCLGELADVMVSAPDIESQFGFAREGGEDRIMESIKARSEICDAEKGDARLACYSKGLKADLRAVAVEKPNVEGAMKEPAVKMKAGVKKTVADK